MPSVALAPKLSAFRRLFSREAVDVAAIYMETCDGVPDRAAAIREQVKQHGLEYPVLDLEAGEIDDPTRKKYSWAPHGLIVDRDGVIVREYGHLPELTSIEADLRSLLAIGMVPAGPADGWRNRKGGSWVRVRIDGGAGGARVEKRTLTRIGREVLGLTIEAEGQDGPLPKRTESLALDTADTRGDLVRKPARESSLDIAGKVHRCRVVDETWKITGEFAATVARRSWIAVDPRLPDQLLRQETTRRSGDRAVRRQVRRVVGFGERQEIGDREVTCWVVEITDDHAGAAPMTTTTRWLSDDVPGQEVASRNGSGGEVRNSSRVVGFEAR